MKKRKQKEAEYEMKYNQIPRDYNDRLIWMYDNMHLNDKLCKEIIDKRDRMINSLFYTGIFIVLYEEPEGSPRPRFRLINRKNLSNAAMENSQFVHVYSITGADDNKFMKRLVSSNDFTELNNLLCTPCNVIFNAFFKTPPVYNRVDTYLAELGCIRPITKPDWDNIGKKYSDMYNSNVWIDDNIVISGTVNKYYSILPRVEIQLQYLNMLYNKNQWNIINGKIDGEVEYFK